MTLEEVAWPLPHSSGSPHLPSEAAPVALPTNTIRI